MDKHKRNGLGALAGAAAAFAIAFAPASASAQLFTGTFELDTFHRAPGPYSISNHSPASEAGSTYQRMVSVSNLAPVPSNRLNAA